MKKYLSLFITLSLFLSNCSVDRNDEKDKKINELEKQLQEVDKEKNNSSNSNLEKKGMCFSKWEEYKSKSENTQIKIFYSPVLDTCIADLWNLSDNWNYFSYRFEDILTGESIWWLGYFDDWLFEASWYLPKVCNKKYGIWKDSQIQNLLTYSTDKDTTDKIYSGEYYYHNCLSYIKWEWTINIKVFSQSLDNYKPTLISPPINYWK